MKAREGSWGGVTGHERQGDEMTPVVQCECKGLRWDSVVCQRCQGSGFRPMRIDDLDSGVPTLAARELLRLRAARTGR